MEAAYWDRVQAVFGTVADLPAEEQAEAAVRLCEGDSTLVSCVLELLREDSRRHGMLDTDAEMFVARAADASLESDHLRSLVQGQIGPYRLLRLLGEGGMGVVYLAERSDIGGLVAIKLLRDAWLSPMRRERFLLEQQVLVKLNHPSIARLYDADTMDDGTPWFVMEYAEGLPLIEALKIRGASLREDLGVFERVCEAVQYAHSHAVIHRDLKPSNILCTRSGEIKLLDFGIAKQVDEELEQTARTITGLRLMTPGYAAPEQSSGSGVGTFTDVYSLGALLYELLTGRLPLRGPDGRITKPSALARGLHPESGRFELSKQAWSELDVLCFKALEAEPKARYLSVDQLSRDIDAFLQGRPLEARRGSFVYKARKFAQRNRLALATLAAAIFLLASATILFTIRLARARDAAVKEARRTETIQRFLQNMLGDEDVEAGPATDLKVVTLLDRAEQQAGALGSDADTQVQLMGTIGSMFARLGKYDRSEQILTKALNRTKDFDRADKRIVDLLVQRGLTRGDHGELKPALQDVQQALNLAAQNHLSASDPVFVAARVAMGRIDVQIGHYQPAIELLRPIADQKADGRTATFYDQRDALSALATAELYVHQYDLAEQDGRRAVVLDRRLFGDSHPRTAEDLMDVGAVETSRGAIAKAEPLYRQGLGILRAWYGPDHPDVIFGSSILARVLLAEKKVDEAETLLEQNLAAEEKNYGPVHERVAFTLDALAELAIRRGQLPAAEADTERALSICRTLFGDKNFRTAVEESNLGRVYLKEKKYESAEASLRHAAQTMLSTPEGSNYTGLTIGRWGEALLGLKRYSEAKQQLLTGAHMMESMPHPPAELVEVRQALSSPAMQ